MELIAVPINARALSKCVCVEVLHSETRLERGLDHDESVIILDADGGFHAAVVDEVGFTLEDTTYRLRMGVRLPADLAAQRLSGSPMSVERSQVHEVADLLGEVRNRASDTPEGLVDIQFVS
ncbi:hypothetical protein NPS01_43160 [Nocardioides psychrotolerans]|uniref:Uncharacterized protein n=1 Tax=Nocardioides psychrotolerans TaxID=1005945 RepID=A0A1I3Q1U4_9ACTN|nr:hypothetical protein [Nocardioides psychrotolerans]GEP40653.1 hypothetical protein NPS01_43160 [Nocardioides psychrotolerans]SFJ27675.1 hypothetical protein SAMN05216561_12310 [Nocardioides psychrotolerans]